MPPPRCKICMENFNSDTNFPMLMPCGRSLCHACVLRYLQDPSQRCFVCVGNHSGVTMDRLQRNYDLMEASVPPDSVLSASRPPGSFLSASRMLGSLLSASRPPDSFMSSSPSVGQSSGTLQLVLQEPRGSKYNLRAHATDTILTVKNLIKNQYGFDPAGTRLIFSGKVLQDGRTLDSYGVKTGNTVQMITDYLGGRVLQARE